MSTDPCPEAGSLPLAPSGPRPAPGALGRPDPPSPEPQLPRLKIQVLKQPLTAVPRPASRRCDGYETHGGRREGYILALLLCCPFYLVKGPS